MKLVLTKGWTGDGELIAEEPTRHQISELIHSLDWSQFNSVRLERDAGNWIDVSGNLGKDGLAIVYEEDGVQFVLDQAPETISQLEEALLFFLQNDKRYRNLSYGSKKDEADDRKKSRELDLWKIEFEARRKKEKAIRLRSLFFFIVILVLGGYIWYLWHNDDLKFLGYKTEFAIAVVTKSEMKFVRGGYFQQVVYEFSYQDKQFKGHFEGNRFTGKHEPGDFIRVKFATEDPSISRRVAKLKRSHRDPTKY